MLRATAEPDRENQWLRCAGHPEPDLWFATPAQVVEATRAQLICRGCPAREACFRGAIARGEPAGIWGGVMVVAGRPVRRRSHTLPTQEMAELRELFLPLRDAS